MAAEEDYMVEDDLSNETRMLVLSFMGLLPADIVSQSGSGSLTSSGSSAERQRRSLPEQSSFDSVNSRKHERSSSDTWQRALPSLPESSLVDRVMSHDKINSDSNSSLWQQQMDDVALPAVTELSTPEEPEAAATGGSDELDHSNGIRSPDIENLQMEEDEPDVISKRLRQAKHERLSDLRLPNSPGSSMDVPSEDAPVPLSTNRSPPSKSKFGVQNSMDRQISNTSSASDATDMSDMSSLMMSTRSTGSRASNYIDLQQVQDMDQMVRQGILPPSVLPLQHQLNQEMEQARRQSLGKSKSPSKSKTAVTPPVNTNYRPPFNASSSVMTPQTEVAEQLRLIGDAAQALYGPDVEQAFNSVISVQKDQLSYDLMEQILIELIEHIPGMSRRVAVVMLLSQRLVMYGRDLRILVNYTVRFLMSKMATYIIAQGGWSQIVSLEDMECSPVTPTDVLPEKLDTDQVDSLPQPSTEPLHTVSTSSTLVPDTDEQSNAESMVDSGFQTTGSDGNPSVTWASGFPSSMTSSGELPRDTTLDSIASLPHDITPVEVRHFPESTAAASNNNICEPKKSDETITSDHKHDEVNEKAVKQARLLRQVSEKLNSDVERERKLSAMLQTFGMATLGSAIVIGIAMFIYKRVKKN